MSAPAIPGTEAIITDLSAARARKLRATKARVRINKIALLKQQQKTRIERIAALKVTLDEIVEGKQLVIDNLEALHKHELETDDEPA